MSNVHLDAKKKRRISQNNQQEERMEDKKKTSTGKERREQGRPHLSHTHQPPETPSATSIGRTENKTFSSTSRISFAHSVSFTPPSQQQGSTNTSLSFRQLRSIASKAQHSYLG
jgi:hypothetical protein